jgi:beta-lactamase superfamily II metal-dependent hydrolase
MPPSNTSTPGPSRRIVTQIAVVALALAFLAWRSWPDGKLRVIFLETKGDAVVIQAPNGSFVLIDGGGDPAALAAALGRNMPFWRRTLAAVVLTNADRTHMPGQVAALERYHADAALAPATLKRGPTLDQWRKLLGEQQTPIRVARPGERLSLGGASLRVLAAGDADGSGLLLRLDYGATSVVFDHSAGAAEEAVLASNATRPVDLLAFPWERDPHTPVIMALRPHALVLTDGQQVDRPVEQTFVERALGGAQLYHERLDGTITWVSDGTRAWVETERPRR